MFADLGVAVNAVVPLGASPDELRTIGPRVAQRHAPRYELARPTLELLHERFGTPYIAKRPVRRNRHDALPQRGRADSGDCRATHPARGAQRQARLVRAHGRRARALGQAGRRSSACRRRPPASRALLHDELDMQVEFAGTYVSRRRRLAARARSPASRDDVRRSPTTFRRSRARSTARAPTSCSARRWSATRPAVSACRAR